MHNSSVIRIDHIDHFVLTVTSIDATCAFYKRVLGMKVVRFESMGTPRVAIAFGNQKINLHQADAVPDPNVLKPTPGSADLCFIASTPISEVIQHLTREQVEIILGPVPRAGAAGNLESIYFRDPDGNLIEVSNIQ